MNSTSSNSYRLQTAMRSCDQMDSSSATASCSLWCMRDASQYSDSSLSDWSSPTQTPASNSIPCSSISDMEVADWPQSHISAPGGLCSSDDSEHLKELSGEDLGQDVFQASCSGVDAESDRSLVGSLGCTTTSLNWDSLLLGVGAGTYQVLRNSEPSLFEGRFNDALYSTSSNQVENSPELGLRKSEALFPGVWDFHEKSQQLGLEESFLNLASAHQSYPLAGQDEQLSSAARLLDSADAWSAVDQYSQRTSLAGALSLHDFSLSILPDFPATKRSQNESSRINQAADIYSRNNMSGPASLESSSNLSLQNLGSDVYKGSFYTANFVGEPSKSSSAPSGFKESIGGLLYPHCDNDISKRWATQSSGRFPAMLSQLLPGFSNSSVLKLQANSMGSGSTVKRMTSYLDGNTARQLDHQKMRLFRRSDQYCCFSTDPNSLAQQQQYTHQEVKVKLEPQSTGLSSSYIRRNLGHTTSIKSAIDESLAEEQQQPVIDGTRSACSPLSTCELTTQSYFKRPRLQQTANHLPFKIVQPRKEKLSERITALQQLVSPFGRTDTASVLTEAITSIKIMHDKVQEATRSYWSSDMIKGKADEEQVLDLRSRGLCLVPLAWTAQLSSENGADQHWPLMHLGGGLSR